LFFEGKKQRIIKELEVSMMRLAKLEKFEEAGVAKRKIFALKHIEDIALVKEEYRSFSDKTGLRVEAYDIAHLAGKDMVGVMVVIQNGEPLKSEYRKFKIKSLKQANDPAALVEVLKRRFAHSEWPKPSLIVVDGNNIQINAARKVLFELAIVIPIVSVVKDEKHKASAILAPNDILAKHKFDILLANSESHRFAIGFYRNLARKNNLK
jgi:excinuclease ABC subunit C